MKSVVYTEPGDPAVLQHVERPAAHPGPGEVRVRVVVAGVNPTDWKTRSGASGPMLFDEVSPGQDGAGVVDALGEGVTGLEVGQRVWLYLAQHGRAVGTAAELTTQPASRVVPLPEGASFDVGASLGVPAITAHRALTVRDGGASRLAPGTLDGQVVLVAGGAGAVGHAAIQLARWAGATVVATVSGPAKAALAEAAGAHHVVTYTYGDPAAEIRAIAPDGVHVVVEVAPGPNAALDAAVLAPHGTIAVYANNGGDQVRLDVRPHMVLNTRWQFVLLYTVGEQALANAAEDVTAAVADGAMEVGRETGLPLHRFPLERTALAHSAVEDNVVGKVLIDL